MYPSTLHNKSLFHRNQFRLINSIKKMSKNINDNNNNNNDDDDEVLKGQAVVYNHLFAYSKTLALRSAIELRIADIIHSHGRPMSLLEIASKLDSPNPPQLQWLERVMRMLVRMHIFTLDYKPSSSSSSSSSSSLVYGVTPSSNLLVHDHEQTLAPMYLALCDHTFMIKPWFEVSRSIKDGEIPFEKANNGKSYFEMASNNEEYSNLFKVGMASCMVPTIDGVIKGYKQGFSELEGTTLVDVAGGNGNLLAKIVDTYPHIKGINFDVPHVIANAPHHPGVTHVSGDMFHLIPSADNIIFKHILHNWTDENCKKILRNCQKALTNKEKGRVIIVDMVLNPFGNGMFDDASVALDLMIMNNSPTSGRERTQGEWNKLLKESSFNLITFIPLQTILSLSIIEAFV